GSLSASGVKLLLPKSCPAKFRYAQDHPRPPKREFDLGHAVHRLVLGVGAELVPIDYETYRGLNARELRDGAYAKGLVPLLRHEYELAQEVAKAVLSDPLAGALFSRGKPEQSLFWVDDETGVWRRSRLDWLPDANSWNGRVVIPDLKTADHADPESFGRALHNYGYASQAAFYVDGVLALGLAEDAAFVFVVVEKEQPYHPDSALVQWAYEARQAAQIAASLAKTSFVPASLRGKPDDITAAILAGQELGLQPMATLRSMDVIQGTPALRAHAMRGLLQSRGHAIQLVESTDARCVMRGCRRGEDVWQEVEWTIQR